MSYQHIFRLLLAALLLGLLGASHAFAGLPPTVVYGTTANNNAGASFTPGTIASGSTVRFDDGTTLANNSTITVNGTLQFNQSTGTFTINNTLAGNGNLALINSGTVQLTGTSAGRVLPLNMTITASNGRLMGVVASGNETTIFQLGVNGSGTLNVAGGLVSGSSWQVGVGSTGVGVVNVTGGTFGPFGALTVGGSSGGSGGTGTLTINGGVVGDNPVTPLNTEGFRFGVAQNSSGVATITNGTLAASATGNGGSFIGLAGTGNVTLNSGYLQAGHLTLGNATTGNGSLNILSGSASTNNLIIGASGSGALKITGGVMKSGIGLLGNATSGTGTVSVTSGTWLVNANGLGSESLGVLRVGGTSGGTGNLTIGTGGYVVVSGSFIRGANGTFSLNQGGTLQIGGQSGVYTPSTASGTASSVGSGTMGVLVGDLNYAGTLKFAQNNNSGTMASSTYSGNLSGSGDLVKTGTGTITLSGSNSYTGGTTVTGGKLALGSANAIGTTGNITFNGGSLQATANNTQDYSSRFSTAANQQYSVDSNGQDLTLAANLTSANGSFTKLGSGNITLTGANSFTSGSAAAGVLIGNATSLATSGTFSANSSAEVRFNQTAPNQTWAGAMVGSGTFTKLGNGTLTLTGSGASTTGTLLVSDGAVKGTTDNIRRNVVNNSQLTFDQTTSGTYSRSITGTGNVLLSNSGTITWTGTNTFTGTTTVAGGRLIGTTSSIQGDVVNNSAVQFNQSTSGTYAGNMSGSGPLAKNSNGALTLTGSNSYEGGTFVNAGSLIGDTGSLQRSIAVSSGTLGFDQATSGTFSGVLLGTSPSSRFVKTGVGDLTLSGTNTNDGIWTVSSGSLIGTTSSLQGAITNNAAVTFDQASEGTYSGAMSGTGSLTKSGAGAVTFSGNSTHTGATTISAGQLVVGGALSNSTATVQSGASIGGSGRIGGLILDSGATLSPGNSPGTLAVNGNATWNGGANYNWQVAAANTTPSIQTAKGSSWDFLDVGGSLTLGLSSSNKFNINLWSLSSTGPDVNGTIAGWDPSVGSTWLIATAVGGISLNGTALTQNTTYTSLFNINTSATNGTGGWLGSLPVSFEILTLGDSNSLYLQALTNAITTSTLYWLGSEGDSWTAANNWSSNATGTPTGNFTASSDIIFSADNSSNETATNLGGDQTIASLTINTTGPVGISGGNLTINGTSATALTVNATAGNVTISAPLILSGSSSTLSIENANTTLASIASANGLVKTGNGTVEVQNRIWVSELGGNLDIQSGNFVSRDGLSLGIGASNETATISGNTTAFSSPTTLNVGYDGSNNALAVESGASASAGSVWIGGTASAETNSVTVNGTGSSLTSSAGGSIAVGYAGANNTLTVSNGSTANSSTAYIGYESTANNNTATVTGLGSTWTNTGAFIVGYNGTGNALHIEDGGSVQNSVSDVQIGFNAGSNNNSLTVNGTGSSLGAGANATLYVGNNGAGNALSVIEGGNLTTFNTRIGSSASSNNNTLTVSGTGSTWSNTATLRVGSSGSGNRLNLLNGATATVAGDIFIGYNTGSANNTVTVNGTDSVLTAGNLTVGRQGSGTLAVLDGGKVVILGGIVKGNSSTVAIGQGGTLQLGNGGAGGLLGLSALQSNGTIIANSSSSYSYNGTISGSGNFIKEGTGTLTIAGTQTYSGGTAVNAGTLALGASNLLLSTGNLSVAGGSFDIGTFQQALKNVTLSSGSIDGTSGTITAQSYAVESGLISAKLAGNASLTKSTNGTVTLSGSNTYSGNTTINEGALVIASTGQISHSNSSFSVAGENSTASVTLDGGSISNFAGYIGFGDGSTGTVNINSGNWTNSDNLRVGYYGNGTLNLTGGNVSNVDGIIGRYSGSNGVANVSGGTWSSSGSMTIGRAATGTLNLTGGNVVVGSGSGNITIAQETVSTGTLNLGNGSTVGSLQAARVTGGNGTAVVNFNHTGNLSFAPILDGRLSVNKRGDGTLNLTGNNSYAGGTTIESGTLTGNNLGLQGNITNNATLLLGTAGTFQLNTSGAGNFVVAAGNNNEVKLLGNATMAGGTTIQSGTLRIGGRNTTDTFILGSIAGDITNEGALRFDMNTGNRTYSGVISGNGSLLSTSSGYGSSDGILYLTGNNTFTGGTTFSHGTLDISGGSLASTGNVTISGGFFDIGASNQTTGNFKINGSQTTVAVGSGILTASSYDLQQGTVSLALSGTAGLAKNTTGSGSDSYQNGVVHLSGNNTATGNITVSSGILSFNTVQSLYSGNNASWTKEKISVSANSTLALGTGDGSATSGFSDAQIFEIFSKLTQNGTGGLTAGSSIGFNVSGGNFTLATAITDRPDLGVLGLDKIGSGALVLGSQNTFTGPLNIYEGTVRAGTNYALSNSTSLVVSLKDNARPATYDIGDFNQQFVNVTLLSGILNGGNGTINATGNYTMVSGDSKANLAGGAPLLKTGNGIVYLYGNSTYLGHTTINGTYWFGPINNAPTSNSERLQFQTPGSLYSDDASKWNGGNITVNQYGILAVRADATGSEGFTENRIATIITNLISANRTSGGFLAGSAFGIDTAGTNMTLSTAFTDSTGQVPGGGAIGFVKYGAGTLTLNGTNNTHSLVTSVTGGTLALAPGTTLSASNATLSVQNASLDLGATSQTVAQVGVSSGSILGSGTLTATTGDYAFSAANITVNLAGNRGVNIASYVGATTLSGNNTHSGNTYVGNSASLTLANLNALAASTLVADSGSTTQFAVPGTYNLGGLSGAGNIAFGNKTLSIGANNQSTSYGSSTGSLSGTGSVIKVGNGTLTFAGDNNYTGGTTITEGTLALGSGGTTGSVTGDIANNAALVFNRSGNFTFANVVSGSGNVTQVSSGRLIVSGANTYTGNTSINAGTLELTGSLESSSVGIASGAALLNQNGGLSTNTAVANSGNFTINAADTIGSLSGSGNTILNAALTTGALGTADEISGTLTGNASLTKAGNGTLSLTGSATNAGGTTISAGTLSIGNGGTTGTVTGNITNNAALVFNRSNNSTFTAGLSGNGSLEKLGAGVLTLANGTRSAGATTINGGGLVLSNASTLNATGPVAVNTGALTIGQGGSLTTLGATIAEQVPSLFVANYTGLKGDTISVFNKQNGQLLGSISGNMSGSIGLTLDSAGTLYVTNFSSNTTSKYISTNGTYLGSISGNMSNPWGVAVDSAGTLYVANNGANSVSKYSTTNGTYLGSISANMSSPSGVAVDGNGTLYVANRFNNIITKYSTANGTYLGSISGNMSNPFGLTVDDNGTVYVANFSTPSITKYSTANGTYLGSISGNMSGPYGVALDGDGTVYVPNYSSNTISKYTSTNGTYLGSISGNMTYPTSVAIGNYTVETTTLGGITLAASASDNATLNIGTLGGSDTTASLSTAFIEFGNGTAALNLNLAGNYTLSANLTGGNSNSTLNQLGTGTTTLTGNNSYTGTTAVNAGKLIVNSNLASTAISIASGAGLETNGGLSANSSVVNSGNFTVKAAETIGSLSGSGNTILNAALTTGGLGDIDEISGTISGNGAIRFDNFITNTNPFAELTANNTYTGSTTVANRTLKLSGNGSIASSSALTLGANGSLDIGSVTANSSTVNNLSSLDSTATIALASNTLINIATDNRTFSGTIGSYNPGGFTKRGNGTLTLAGNNYYSGATSIEAGVLFVSGSLFGTNSPLAPTAVSVSSGATYQLGSNDTVASIAGAGSIHLDSYALTLGVNSTTADTTFSGVVSGANGSLTKAGTGTLTLTGNNTYTGGTFITSGTLEGNTQSLQGAITNNASLVFNQSTNGTYSGALGGTGTLSKNGTGTLTLNGTSSYGGSVAINSGTLKLEASLANATFVVDGGTLAGGNITVGAVTINDGSTIAPGSSPGIINTGNMTWNGGGTYAWELGNATGIAGTDWDLIRSSGTLAIGANATNKFTIAASTTNASGFDPNAQRSSWTIAEFANITGFTSGAFNITTTGFEPGLGVYSVSANSTALSLNYATMATWNAGTGSWTTNNNWESDFAPIDGVAVEYAGPLGTNGTSTNDDVTLANISGLTFTSGANGSFTIAGGNLTLGAGGIVNNSTFTQTVGINLALGANQTFAVNTGNLVVSGNMTGAYSLTKAGNHTLVLAGTNSYTGPTVVEKGALVLAKRDSLYNGNNASWTAANISVGLPLGTSGGNTTFAGLAGGAALVLKAGGAGEFTADDIGLLGNNLVNGTVSGNIATGFGAFGTLGIDTTGGNITMAQGLASGNTLSVNGSNYTQTYSLLKLGSGTLDLAGNNTFSFGGGTGFSPDFLSGEGDSISTTVVNAGTLRVGSGATLATPISFVGGNPGDGATLQIDGGTFVSFLSTVGLNPLELSSLSLTSNSTPAFTGQGVMNVTGGNVMSLFAITVGGANGQLNISGGNVTAGMEIPGSQIPALGLVAGLLPGTNGTINVSGGNVTAANIALGGPPMTPSDNGNFGGNGTLNITGGNVTAGNVYLGSSNASLGVVNVSGGNLLVAGGSQPDKRSLQSSSQFIVGGEGTGLLSINGTGKVIVAGTLSKGNLGTIALESGGTLQIGMNGTDGFLDTGLTNNGTLVFDVTGELTHYNAIDGTGAVQKTGLGTLVLSGTSNTYSGATSVNAGTLLLDSTYSNPSTTISVLANGTLAGSGTAGDVTVLANGTISPTTVNPGGRVINPDIGTLTVGNLTLNGGGIYDWQLASATGEAGADWDLISATGAISINATAGNAFTIAASTTNASGFDPAARISTWKIAESATGISGFSADKFNILTTGFEPGIGAYFMSVANDNKDLNLNYATMATWNAGTGNWTTTSNWQDSFAPVNGVAVEYAGPLGTNGTSTNDDVTLANISGLTFTSGANGSFTIAGGNLTLGAGGIVNNSTFTQTVGINLALIANQTFAANTGNLVVSGDITGDASLTKEGNSTLILSGLNSYTGETTINAGTLAIAAGGSLNGTSKIFVGNTTSSNTLDIFGSVGVGNLTLSHQVGSNDNTVTVGGGSSPASLTVGNLINVGFGGTGNALDILDNGTVTAASTWIGGYGANNSVNLTGGVLNSTSDVIVGYFADDNALNITAGGNATTGSIIAGLDAGSSNNTILVSGSGSALHTSGLIYLGQNGTSNILTIEDGGKVVSQNADAVIGLNVDSNGNALSINGTGSQLTNNGTVHVGKGGSENTLTIANGGSLTTRNSRIGYDATSSNNTATISGTGSTWANTGTLRVGSAGSGNTLAVSSGANVTVAGNTFIGYSVGSGNNLVSVQGAGSVLNLANATVGLGGTNNTLLVADSGTINAIGIQLSGTNSTLQIGNGTAAGTLTTSLGIGTGNGTGHQVVFNHTDSNLVFNPILTGNLALSHIGNGTTSLVADSTYTGGTTISTGTLQIGNNGTTGSVTGDITNNGTLAFNRSDAVEYAGVISGSGSLNKLAANTLTLTGNNTYIGNTTISAGTLQLGNGGASGSVTGAIVNNGVLAINRSDDLTFTNTLTGTGSVLKLSTNTLTYNSTTSPAGGTTVNAGTLLVTGTTSSVAVNNSGTLAGTGTIGDVIINSGGAIAPGSSPGTISVGNLTINGGGIYNWQTSSINGTAGTDWDLISSAGILSLNATSGNPISLSLSTLNGATLAGVKKASWEIGNFTTDITGFDKTAFSINPASMEGTDGRYYMTLGAGNKTLVLNYKTAATWNTGSGNWTTTSQWENDSLPADGDEVEFTGSGGLSTNNFASGNLSYISGFSFLEGAGAYTVGGNTLQIREDGIVNSSNQTQTISMNLTAGEVLSVNATTGNLLFSGVFSGNSSLAKSGGQILTLSGNNTYTGGTTISAGTIALGGTEGAVLGNITVDSGATFAVNRTNNATLSNLIGGAGAFAHVGSNTTSMVTNNTYLGGTSVQNGTLWVKAPQALGTGNVTLNGGKLLVTSSQELSMGNQTLSIGGNFDWSSGTLAYFDTGTSPGSGDLTIGVAGNFTVSTVGNAIFDFSGVEALDAGNYTLVNATAVTADNNKFVAVHGQYTTLFGNFTTTNNTVVYTVTGAESTGSDIQNNGGPNTPVVAVFDVTQATQTIGANNTVNALDFSNSASLTINATGQLTVTSGTLGVQTGSSLVSGGTLNTPGNFDKTGAGELDLQSNASVNGTANVVAGLLSVNGQLNANSVVVDPNATLGGAGVIVAPNVVVNGNLAPGNSPGTLNVVGNLVLTGANSTIIEIASLTNFDRIVVTGTATLGGTLNAVAYGGGAINPGARYNFLQAGSIVGTYDSLIAPDGLRVRFLNSGTVGTLLFGPSSYVPMAINQNQRNVAKALDTFILATNGDRLAVSIALDSLTTEQFPSAFDQIMPGFYESLANIAIEQAFAQTQMLNQRISSVRLGAAGFQAIGGISQPLVNDKNGKSAAEAKDASPIVESATATNWNSWALGTGTFSRSTNLGSLQNYNNDAGGFLVGADYRWSEDFVTGLYAGYDYSYAEYNGGSSTKGNSVNFGTYASYAKDGYYADAVIGGGYTGFQTKRSIQFSTIDRTASADPNSGQFTAGLNLGKDFEVGQFTLGPIMGAQYTYAGIGSFTESGAESLDLSLGQQNANSLRSTLGGRIAYTWNLNQKIALIPEVRMFWQHEFLNNPRTINSSLDGGNGPSFGYETITPYRDSVFAGAGVTAQFGKNLSGSVFYNINFGSQTYQSNMVSAGLNFSF